MLQLLLTRTRARALVSNRRLVLAILLVGVIAGSFWFGSRIPALNEKAMMQGETQLSGLGFTPLLPLEGGESIGRQLVYNSVNWVNTNRQGMTFGLLFAAALMTVFALIPRPHFRGRMANTLLGMGMGAPLGVCVNCATPIAQGMHAAGARPETMLAALMSSPTLNFIVLTMLVAMLPLYLVGLKVGLTVLFILAVVPLLTRWLPIPAYGTRFGSSALRWMPALTFPQEETCDVETEEGSWRGAGWWVARRFGRNLWFIVRTTVPLMILAGVLGAVAVTLLPFDALSAYLAQLGGLRMMGAVVGVAVLGVLLPVPMAFDVILVAVLYQAGLPVRYAAVLLVTLGMFSVYPFALLWQTVSRQMAAALLVGLVGLGVLAGAGGHTLDKWASEQQRMAAIALFSQSDAPGPRRVATGPPVAWTDEAALVAELQKQTVAPVSVPFLGAEGVTVARRAFKARAPRPGPMFRRAVGPAWGLAGLDSQPGLTGFEPWSFFRGIAAGDVHGDGWVDVAVATDTGLRLYANKQGTRFEPQRVDIPFADGTFVTNVALVDLDDDGWLDLYFATYRRGNHVVYNRNGRFLPANLHRLPNMLDAVTTGATGFADLDRDGDLDVVLGNWASPPHDRPDVAAMRDAWLEATPDSLRLHPLDGFPGESFSVLLTDLDRDGHLDLWMGNDRQPPDNVYLGDGAGGFAIVRDGDGLLPYTTWTSMSLAVADVDNDLSPEIYEAQIAWRDGERHSPAFLCAEVEDPEAHADCLDMMHVNREFLTSGAAYADCGRLTNAAYVGDCVASNLMHLAFRENDPALCELLPPSWGDVAFSCTAMTNTRLPDWAARLQAAYREGAALAQTQTTSANSFFVWDGERYVDRAEAFGIAAGGWSWNAKFADLDNDEWQDLYIVNNMPRVARRSSHYFYHNRQGQRFENETEAFGLTSYRSTRAYSYLDFDNDGDLDIITVPTVGPLWVYENQGTRHHSLSVSLRDGMGNHFGVGSTIVIYYGEAGERRQMRELFAGSGFASFDAPIAHFGLGEYNRVERIEVLWSTGERSVLPGPFVAGYSYTLTRESEPPAGS